MNLTYNGTTLISCSDDCVKKYEIHSVSLFSKPNYIEYKILLNVLVKDPDDKDDQDDNDFDTPILIDN